MGGGAFALARVHHSGLFALILAANCYPAFRKPLVSEIDLGAIVTSGPAE